MVDRIDWAHVVKRYAEQNGGLLGILDKITEVMTETQRAVFVEDDCLPSPGFYDFMTQCLEYYDCDKQVFSIGGYQPISRDFFRGDSRSLVSSMRFLCWGWATWQDRWKDIIPGINAYNNLFNKLRNIPTVAGDDIPDMARACSDGRAQSWDIKVMIATLSRNYAHLLPTRGLIRNIGLTSGEHGLLPGRMGRCSQNRNVAANAVSDIEWLADTRPDRRYQEEMRRFVATGLRRNGRNRALLHRVAAGLRRRSLALATSVCPNCVSASKRLRNKIYPEKKDRFYNMILEENNREPKKHALLSYVTHPFSIPWDDPRYLRHNNIRLAHGIVRALNRDGYAVDVVDRADYAFEPEHSYDLIISTGGRTENYIRQLSEHCLRIYFATGRYWRVANEMAARHFADLRLRRGVNLQQSRYCSPIDGGEMSLRVSDGIIVLGNLATASTYSCSGRVVCVDGMALPDDHCDQINKAFDRARRNFLYFAGDGCVHKGLDLLLEVFSRNDRHLWICSRMEDDFADVYDHELNDLPNIHMLGWVQPRSSGYYDVMDRCQYVILPSASEGQAQSVIECMNHGLVPIVSAATGIDVPEGGEVLNSCSMDEIRDVVEEAASRSPSDCRSHARASRQLVLERFTEEVFIDGFARAVEEIATDKKVERRAAGRVA
ncbi:MAG: glycosyltransferase family 4 protein [Lentisphaerae bacterium]|nr:glycosyltransferase family 4 protein [Lentisphaerota bacterium]